MVLELVFTRSIVGEEYFSLDAPYAVHLVFTSQLHAQAIVNPVLRGDVLVIAVAILEHPANQVFLRELTQVLNAEPMPGRRMAGGRGICPVVKLEFVLVAILGNARFHPVPGFQTSAITIEVKELVRSIRNVLVQELQPDFRFILQPGFGPDGKAGIGQEIPA